MLSLLCTGLLILQPDVLLSGTRIAGSFKCPRLSVLEERFGGDSNAKAMEGTLLHDLLQVSHACCGAEWSRVSGRILVGYRRISACDAGVCMHAWEKGEQQQAHR